MRNTRILAQEELEDVVPAEMTPEQGEEATVDADAAQTDAELADVGSEAADVADSAEVGERLDSTIEIADKAIERGDGLTPEAAEVAEVAVEGYYQQLGLRPGRFPSLEGFADSNTRLATTKKLRADMVDVRTRLDEKLEIAQEGIGARVVNAVERAFTSRAKVLKKLPEAVKNLEDKGAKTAELADVAWGRVFATSGKKAVNGKDVEKLVADLLKARQALDPMLKEANEVLAKATKAVDSSNIIARDEKVKELEELDEQAKKLTDKFVSTFSYRIEKGAVDAAPLDAKEAKKLAEEVERVLNDEAHAKLLKRTMQTIDEVHSAYINNGFQRLAGFNAQDIKAYGRLLRECSNGVYSVINYIERVNFLMSYGIYKYVKASAQ